MREVSYTDIKGRMWRVKLPDGVPDSDAPLGIPVGPPPLEELGLPEDIEIALHNQLFSRRIFTVKDIKRNRADALAAIQGALKLDVEKLHSLYLIYENGHNDVQKVRK